ncbi:hypothetical protein FRB94_008144 [Tulasnella sp. JGI-2019a]|nr:hypothetical protein FRB94_008144 [Tulasnella sp. JGI-2019a]KAG9018410.1 hypothetical protein FRB93_000113 [Tulasnella sp. JGI-2019a]
MPWKKIVREKQASRSARLEVVLAPSNLKVVDEVYLAATAPQIVQNIQKHEPGWTAENVLTAFARRAIRAQEVTNCLTEVMIIDALEDARRLDREFAQTNVIKGPLHGVPVSFKDMYNVKGYDSSLGFTKYSQLPMAEDAELVAQVRAAGGIPFVKTNVPQTMMAWECANPVFGRTLNPWSANHTCGGSSGGEGALLGCDGSALGFGSDIGGSLRIPTSFCGAYSLKPGGSRFTSDGTRVCLPGFEAFRDCKGPMGRSVEDIELACRVLFGKSNLLHDWLPPVAYRDIQLAPKLKFGYFKSDTLMRASPAVQRAVQETIDALRSQGHECVEFAVPDMVEMARIFVALTAADGHETLLSHLGSDDRDSSLFLLTLGPRLPGFVRNFVAFGARLVLGDPIFEKLFTNSRSRSVTEYWAEAAKRDRYSKLFFKEVWEKHAFDGLVCPVNALPTIPHGTCADLAPLALTTALFNVVDHPVGVVPVTRVDKAKDQLTDEWRESGAKGSSFIYAKAYEGKKPAYDATAMHGIPIGVQIVGKPWEDEKVIEMMKVVDVALGKRDFGPGVWGAKQTL